MTDPIVTAWNRAQREVVFVQQQPESYPASTATVTALVGRPVEPKDLVSGWIDLVERTTARGVAVMRLRVLQRPPSETELTSLEHSAAMIEAGETVVAVDRSLVRQLINQGKILNLDFWAFDQHTFFLIEYDQDGRYAGESLVTDRGQIKLIQQTLEALLAFSQPLDDFLEQAA